jgi:hypothetical protein
VPAAPVPIEAAPTEVQPPAEPSNSEPRTPISRKSRDIEIAPEPAVEVPTSVDPFDRPAIFDGFGKRSVRFGPGSARQLVSRD